MEMSRSFSSSEMSVLQALLPWRVWRDHRARLSPVLPAYAGMGPVFRFRTQQHVPARAALVPRGGGRTCPVSAPGPFRLEFMDDRSVPTSVNARIGRPPVIKATALQVLSRRI